MTEGRAVRGPGESPFVDKGRFHFFILVRIKNPVRPGFFCEEKTFPLGKGPGLPENLFIFQINKFNSFSLTSLRETRKKVT
jgi:hypothetical protein